MIDERGRIYPPHIHHTRDLPSVIRIWNDNHEPLDYLIEHFDHGFAVPRSHPITLFLWSDQFFASTLTVESTPEFMWKPIRNERLYNGGTEVYCEPWIDGFRNATLPDWYFLEMERKKSSGAA